MTINKMINLETKKSLGTINGTLISYSETTVISPVIVLLFGDSRLADLFHWSTVPLVSLLGDVFDLVMMVLTVIMMERVRISYSIIILSAGQLGTDFIPDATAVGKVVLFKLLSLLTVAAGISLDQMAMGRSTEIHLKGQG